MYYLKWYKYGRAVGFLDFWMTDLCVIIISEFDLLNAYIMKPITDKAVDEVSLKAMEMSTYMPVTWSCKVVISFQSPNLYFWT